MSDATSSLDHAAAPERPTIQTPAGPSVLSSEEVRAVVGWRRDQHYRWIWTLGPFERSFFGFSVGALVFECGWLLYRKMYREFLVAFGARVFLAAALLPFWPRATPFISGGVVAFILAVGGGSLYRRHALGLVAKARAEIEDPERRLAWLRARGGVNWPAFLLYAAASLVAAVAFR